MFGSSILEIGIGLALMYFILSLMCTTITELIARGVNMRAKTLAEGIRSLLMNPEKLGDVQKLKEQIQEMRKVVEGTKDKEIKRLFERLERNPQLQQVKRFEEEMENHLRASDRLAGKTEKHSRASDRLTNHERDDLRAKMKALSRAMGDQSVYSEKFYAHPLIARLHTPDRNWAVEDWRRLKLRLKFKPIEDQVYYIAPKDFSLVLLDLLAPEHPATGPEIIAAVKASIRNLPDGNLKTSLNALLLEAEGDLTKLRQGLERWFNDTMNAVQGWYRRRAQLITLVIALIVTLCANADTLTVADKLSRDAAFRSTVVAAATKIAEQPPVLTDGGIVTSTQKIQDLQNTLITLDYPIGWPKAENTDVPDPRRWTRANWPSKLFGILLTWLLVSLGAPFWYDMLSKLVNLRAAGKPPETTTKPEIPGMDDLTKQVADLKEAVAKLPPSG